MLVWLPFPPDTMAPDQKSSDELEKAVIPFDSHDDALDALRQVGYTDADRYPDFWASSLTAAVGEILSDKVTVMDMTDCIPTTASAAYQALTVLGVHGGIYSRGDDNAAFLVLRTKQNTPSFLFGVHYNIVQAFGREVADSHVRTTPTPAAFVFFRGRQIPIPSSVCAVDELLASRFIACEITQDDSYFCCGICGTGFVTRSSTGSTVQEVAVTECGHMFRRECAMQHIERTGSGKCPTCDKLVAPEKDPVADLAIESIEIK